MRSSRYLLAVICILVLLALAGCSSEEKVVVHNNGHWSNLQGSGVFKDYYNHYAKGAVENVAEEPSPAVIIEVVFLNNRGRALCRKGIWVGEIGPGETEPFEARCDDYTRTQSFDWRYEITYQ